MESLERTAGALPLLSVVAVLVLLAMWLCARVYRLRMLEELGEKRNVAVAVFAGGFLVAVVVAVAATMTGRGAEPLGGAMLWVLGEGSLVVALMVVSAVLHDRLLFRQFDVGRELVEDRNLGAAFCMMGSLVASGLVLNGAATGYAAGLGFALRDTAIFWALGQAIVAVAVFVHTRTRRQDLRRLIGREDNPAVGLALGGFLIGVGTVVRGAILGGGGEGMASELGGALGQAVFGIFVLSLVRVALKVWLLPRVNLDLEITVEKNVGAAVLVAGAYVGTGILLGVVS